MQKITPPRLKFGDTIGICAPCSAPEEVRLSIAIKTLSEKGFNIKLSKNIYRAEYGFSGTEQERADDFNGMILDDTVKMVLFGGGYSGCEVLPYLDYAVMKTHPKILCSYSNGTVILNAVTAKTGLITYLGQTPRTFYSLDEYNFENFCNILINGENIHKKASDWTAVGKKANGKGEIIGGYLGDFAMILNREYCKIDKRKRYILILEDHEIFSQIEAVFAYLSHIGNTGFYSLCECLIFGHYSDNSQDEILKILGRLSQKYDLPVIKCDDFGHGRYNALFPIGRTGLIKDSQELYFL